MKRIVKVLRICRKPVCAGLFLFCLICLLGCAGTAEQGGSLMDYAICSGILLVGMIAAGAAGGFYK